MNQKNKYIRIIVVSVLFCSLVMFFVFKSDIEKTVTINKHEINVEIADTAQKRKEGLSNRQKLCADCGMLFIFDEIGGYKFWMKDMKFDIDIIWISGNEIVGISKNVSHKTPQKLINVNKRIDKVLELNAGTVSSLAIDVGKRVYY